MDIEFQNASYGLQEDEFVPFEDINLKGDDIQKLSVIQALPQLLQTEPHATYARIIPKILQELPNSSCEFHVTTSKIFRVLMEKQVPINLLHAVLQGIESRDPIVANAWMETLLAIISVLTDTQLKNEIIPMTKSKSQLSQQISSRVASCRILGKLAVHRALEPIDVKRDVLPLVQSLCQDCHPDVRTAMCVQLPQVAQGLGPALVKSTLLTSLVELASDENMYVRSAAITATVQMFPYVTLEIKKTTILQLAKQLCEKSLRSVDLTTTTVAKEIGKLVDGLQLALTVNESIWFLHCYKTLAHRGLSSDIGEFRNADTSMDVMCRQHCASNLPSIAHFTFTSVPGQVEVLYSIFRDLAADPCYMVRRTVAGCIHEVVKIFGSQSKMLKTDMVRLLRDDSEDVLQMLVPHMGTTLELFCTHGTLSRQSSNVATVEMGRAILKCQYEIASGYNWRLLAHFLHQLEHLPNCMPPDFIHQQFTPVVLNNAVQGRSKPVRSQAARTLLVFLRFNSKEMQRKWLRDNLTTQLCYSTSCYTRHIFIRLCVNAMDIFSEKYFKEYFYENLLDLAADPVANIRLCVANLFASLKQMLVLPEDQVLSDRLKEVFERYVTEEKDRDVMEVFQRNMEEIRNAGINYNKEEHAKEEKRRQEEENRLALGVKSNLYLRGKKDNVNKPSSRPGSITNKQSSSSRDLSLSKTSSSQRSLSVPPKTGASPNTSSDMNFLEQHFYIDAGVNLPTKPLSSETNSLSVGKLANSCINKMRIIPQASNGSIRNETYFSKEEKQEIETSSEKLTELELSCNITDDDKVNLRKLSSNNISSNNRSNSERKNKRYSSILSTTCLEKSQERKALNRRSLNITTKESSRIPVCYKSSTKKVKNTLEKSAAKEGESHNDENKPSEDCNDVNVQSKVVTDKTCVVSSSKSNLLALEGNNNSNQSSFKATSHLPVFKRRSVSEVRRPF